MGQRSRKVNQRLGQRERMRRCELQECRGACCLYGAWVDEAERVDILDHADVIRRYLLPDQSAPDGWFDGRTEPDDQALSGVVHHTTVVPNPDHYGGTVCVFFRPDYRCALQVAAEELGEHPWRFKPFYCVLHPLDLDSQGHITLDSTDALLQEPASCLRPNEKNVPLTETFEPELRYLLGDRAYEQLCSLIAQRFDGLQAGSPVGGVEPEE